MQIALTFRNVLRNVKRRVLHTLGPWMCYITRRVFLWLENSLNLPLETTKNPPKIVPFPQNQEQSRCKQKVFRKFVVQFHGRKIPQNQFVVRFWLSCRRFLFFVSEHSGQHVRERNKKMQCERSDGTQAAWESYLYSIYLKNYETHILERQWAKGLCGQGILRIYRSP